MTTYAYADLVRSLNGRADSLVIAQSARVHAEIARDEEARADRAAALNANARRNASLKVVRMFRATLARFEREVPSTDASDKVLRLANGADAELRAGGAPEGLAAIIGEMAAMLG